MAVHPYFQQKIVLTTKHDKLRLIQPAFEQMIGCTLIEANLDTDQLGTFSGEIARLAPPRETAIQKARLGMIETGLPFGIASEGSVGPDLIVPFLNSNIEHLVLVDDQRKIVIHESYRSLEITAVSAKVLPNDDLSEFLKKADFPAHRLIVHPNTPEIKEFIKGIGTLEDLVMAIEKCASMSPDGVAVVESDLRAMYSPSRQRNIEHAAQALARRVSQLCPDCQVPGWGQVGYEKGVKCTECGFINLEAVRQEILGCISCEYRELGTIIATELDPAKCQFCNP